MKLLHPQKVSWNSNWQIYTVLTGVLVDTTSISQRKKDSMRWNGILFLNLLQLLRRWSHEQAWCGFSWLVSQRVIVRFELPLFYALLCRLSRIWSPSCRSLYSVVRIHIIQQIEFNISSICGLLCRLMARLNVNHHLSKRPLVLCREVCGCLCLGFGKMLMISRLQYYHWLLPWYTCCGWIVAVLPANITSWAECFILVSIQEDQ